MKYIDADRLRKAVEKKYNSNDTVGDRWDLGYDTACEQILEIIDSLQQEFEINEFSFKGGTATINGVEHSFKPGKAKVIILDITENEG